MAGAIETRSIDWIPTHERKGKVHHQAPFWFTGNFVLTTMVTGFLGPANGLSVGWSVLAAVAGACFGTLFMCFHANQGPTMGLPQMIQSRAQFGSRGALVPFIAVIFVFLQDLRSTLIPAITIPVSLIGTFIFVKLFGFSINTLTLFGITLATGLVVDDAIVVIENIERHMRERKQPARSAASSAMGEVASAVIATSLVLVAVLSFLPLLFVLSQVVWDGAFRPGLASVVALTAMAALLVYCLVVLFQSLTRDLALVTTAVDRMVAGDLRQALNAAGDDELGRLVGAVGQLGRTVSAMVANVRSNAAFVNHAGQSLARGSSDLSDRTEQQAANLEQTAASVEQLSSTVQENANTASLANRKASEVRDVADQGASTMAQAVESVEAIQASAKRMDEIVGVIDGLAFQTNILALNAAVEAARAGESGRGFAVVATEVRSLAQRSAEAAKEIRLLISTSSGQVATSVQKIRAAGTTISITELGGQPSIAATVTTRAAARHMAKQTSGVILHFGGSGPQTMSGLGGFKIVQHKLELYGLCPKAQHLPSGICPNENRDALVGMTVAQHGHSHSHGAKKPAARRNPPSRD